MGKIVKYCAACDESFAERFGFCPNCGQAMTAFEMNPVAKPEPVAQAPQPETPKVEPVIESPKIAETPKVIETPAPVIEAAAPPIEVVSPSAQTVSFSANQTQAFSYDDLVKEDLAEEEIKQEIKVEPRTPIIEPTPAKKAFAAAAGANVNKVPSQNTNSSDNQTFDKTHVKPDEDFHITVIEEKNGKQRNVLLLGAMALILTLALGSTVYSLFNKDLGVGAIDDGSLFAAIVVDDVPPVEIEEQPKPKKDDTDGGGGGGGGKEEPKPASKGRLVSQSENPITPPDAKSVQLTNPDIKLVYETKGTIKRPVTEERPGLPGSDNLNPSNGTGRGGGIGSGNGTGIGGGNGTGEGNGNGSGSGNGNGNGNGNGTGDGNGRTPPPPPPSKPIEVVTVPFRIISRPKPPYTDAARQNQVTGVVRLRVTFSANGQIGGIAPISGLPYGLTEQAIAAARQIKFEPAKKNGVAVASTKIIEYNFAIY